MPKTLYVWTRDLHLYLGLFVSPFVIVFALSVFFVNHLHPTGSREATSKTVSDLRVPEGILDAQGMEQVELAEQILSQVGVAGEVNFIRTRPKERRMTIPVVQPGVETTIELDLEARSAEVAEYRTAFWERLAYLHRSPGPHNVAIRGNWLWTQVWRWLADATVYIILCLSVSGVYLWTALRAERRIGLALLGAGALTFAGMIYAVVGQ